MSMNTLPIFPVHIKSRQSYQAEVEITRSDIGARYFSVQREYKPHCVFSNRIRRICGNAQHAQLPFCGGNINIVKPCAAQQYHLDALFRQSVYRFRVYIVVNKSADCLCAFRKLCVFRTKPADKIFYLKLCVISVKPFLIVWLCVIKSDFFHKNSPYFSLQL